MAVAKVYVCSECPSEQHFTWLQYRKHMREAHGKAARLSLVKGFEDPPKTAFTPRLTGECGVCHVEGSAEKLGVCGECGGQFCGGHILDHRCPLPLVI